VEPDAGAPAVDADGIAAVEAGGIAAVEDCIGAAGAVAAGAAMVEDSAGFPLSPLLPPHAASPTTNADATTIRVSFMGSFSEPWVPVIGPFIKPRTAARRHCRDFPFRRA
jgi:hypothetical protein